MVLAHGFQCLQMDLLLGAPTTARKNPKQARPALRTLSQVFDGGSRS